MTDLDHIARAWTNLATARGQGDASWLAPNIEVLRCGNWDERGKILDIFSGPDSVVTWLARTPKGTTFTLISSAAVDDDGSACVRYRITIEDFVNEGEWRFKLNPAGQLVWLWHQADELS